jgi:hypothetical protein
MFCQISNQQRIGYEERFKTLRQSHTYPTDSKEQLLTCNCATPTTGRIICRGLGEKLRERTVESVDSILLNTVDWLVEDNIKLINIAFILKCLDFFFFK